MLETAKVRLGVVSWFSVDFCLRVYRLGRGLPAWLCFHHAFSVSLASSCSSHHHLGCACVSQNMREESRIFIIQQFFQIS